MTKPKHLRSREDGDDSECTGPPRAPFVLASIGALAIALTLATASAGADRKTENVVLVTIDGLRWQEVFSGADPVLLSEDQVPRANLSELRQRFWNDEQKQRRKLLMPFLTNVVARQGWLLGGGPMDESPSTESPSTESPSIESPNTRVELENPHRFSYPGYSELLTGFFDPRIISNDKIPNPNITVLEWLQKRAPFEGQVAAFASWDVMSWIVNVERSGVYTNSGWEPLRLVPDTPAQQMLNQLMATTTPEWQGVRFDSFTFYSALEYLAREQPKVLFLGLGEPDDWAHEGRYDKYLQSAALDDRLLRELWNWLESSEHYRGKTTLVVTTDHGRGATANDWRNHGADVTGAERGWIALLGPDLVRPEAVPEVVTLAQIAATVAAALGQDYHGAVAKSAPPLPWVVASP